MAWFQDDLFYYLKIASNLVAGHGSTFDGVHQTNGYHPLYFALLCALTRINAGFPFLCVCLCLLGVLASVVSVLAIRSVLQQAAPENAVLADPLAVLVLVPCFNTFYQGMETTLTLPLGFLLLAWWSRALTCLTPARLTPASAAFGGLLAALLVLSRLDSALLVVLLIAATALTRKRFLSVTPAASFSFASVLALCLVPYFTLNKLHFGAWLPISGVAKQLRIHHTPSLAVWRSVLQPKASLYLSLAAIVLFVWLRSRLNPSVQVVLASAIAFRWLHFGVISVVSDWPLWGWYFYSVRFAILAFFALAAAAASRLGVIRHAKLIANSLFAVALLLLPLQTWVLDPTMADIHAVAVALSRFATTHPGAFAMGDRAGMVGYLLPDPVYQTEGLVSNLAFLDHIRREDDLRSTLRHEGVRYYVTSTPAAITSDSCLLASEPALAGPDSHHMRSRFCAPPILTLPGAYITRVFDLEQQP